jgi:predicted porin
MSASVTGEFWNSRGRDIVSAGADLSYKFTSKLKTSIGTSYSLYKYDYLADKERDNVQTYYVKLSYNLTKEVRSEIDYEFEDDEFEEYHVLRTGLTWSF